jgi:hypothetical protein
VDESQQRGSSVEQAVAAAEGGVGDEAAPALADEGRAGEARGVARREVEEDLFDGVMDMLLRWRPAARVWFG